MVEEIKNIIFQNEDVFRQKKEILAVYLFGSQITGFSSKESDLDLAVLVTDKNKISAKELLKLLLAKNSNLSVNLHLSLIDMETSPIFLYQIVKNGVCVYEKEPYERIKFESRALSLYYDNEHLRNIYHYYLQRSFKEGNYGYRQKSA